MDEEHYMRQLRSFRVNPTTPSMIFLCSYLESCFQFSDASQKDLIKSCALQTIRSMNEIGGEFSSNENLLRIYNLIGKVSQNMGSIGIYDHLEKNGDFVRSLKFHLYWAEAHAKAGNAQRFREIVELAKSRINSIMPSQLEAGFRDIADEHLSGFLDLFHDDTEDTFYCLSVPRADEKKSRRRSSLAEWRVAKLQDSLFEDVSDDMDISVERTIAAGNDDMDMSVVETAPTVPEKIVDPSSTSSSSQILKKTPCQRAPLNPQKLSARKAPALPVVMEEKEEQKDTAAPSAFMRMRKSIGGANSLLPHSRAQTRKVTSKPADSTMEKAMVKLSLDNSNGSSSEGILERTGIGRPLENISGSNPWDVHFRQAIMEQKCVQKPVVLHQFKGQCPKIMKNREVELGGELFQVHDLLGQGAFARVYDCTNELGEKLALKHEVPSCQFEVYICEQLKQRLMSAGTFTASLCRKSVMEVRDGYVYQNASVLINSYIPCGTLLDLANRMHDPSGLMILYIAMQMAAILKEVHEAQIIHADVKPDNFMVQSRLNESLTKEELFSTPLLKLIDWGRAIDMKFLSKGTTFTGKAGTKDFDCPEMMLGLPWSYHTDFYGFIGTLCVLLSGKYCSFTTLGEKRAMSISLKRRLIGFDVFNQIINELINLPEDGLPSWSNIIQKLRKAFMDNFDVVEWRKAVAKFNSSLPV